MTWLMGFFRPAVLLSILALVGTILCLYAVMVPGITGVWAIVSISACLSLMFPTIYSIALDGLGSDTKFGSAGLVMAILGGLGTIFGAILGVFVYESLHYGIEHMTQYWMFWMGSLIILMVLLLKSGIAGLIEQLVGGKRK